MWLTEMARTPRDYAEIDQMKANMRSTEGLTREDRENNRSIVIRWRERFGYHPKTSAFDNREDHMEFIEGVVGPEIFQVLSGPLPTRGPDGPYVVNPKSGTTSTKIKSFKAQLQEDLQTGEPSELTHIYAC